MLRVTPGLLFGFLGVTLAACDGGSDPSSAQDAKVDFSAARQHITGFGASSAWASGNLSDTLADQFFSVENGIGLSLLRMRIAPEGKSGELETARKAIARGARVWAAPWSPPGEWKTSGDARNGGSLLPAHRRDWAERLAAFVKSAADEGVPLSMLSAQNEPGYVASWETCEWKAEELTAFVRDELGPALERAGLDIPILAPETQDWGKFRLFADSLLEDAGARAFLGAVATHSYGGRAFAYDTPGQHGLELWQTEIGDPLPNQPPDPGMASALRVAELVHEHLVVASVNAWHFWWIMPSGQDNDNQALMTSNGADGTITRRAFALGNFSKFVRPGFVRVETVDRPQSGVTITAFRDPTTKEYAIVATNSRDVELAQRFVITGSTLATAVPWETSSEFALERQAQIPLEADGFTYLLPPASVTTFAGALGDP
jgi:glucuronoarabinoxylan endo-1,4-beta-xylanase